MAGVLFTASDPLVDLFHLPFQSSEHQLELSPSMEQTGHALGLSVEAGATCKGAGGQTRAQEWIPNVLGSEEAEGTLYRDSGCFPLDVVRTCLGFVC